MDERGCLLLPDAEVDKKREQEWQPKTAAAEEPDKKDTSGAVQTEESPKRDDADAKPFGTSKHSVYFPTRRICAVSIENSKNCMSLYSYLKIILFLPYITLFIIVNYILLLVKTIQI